MSKKILVIESDAPFARELSSAIEARGLEARITGDGKEGFDLAKVDRPDAIVLCVELPRMSGYSICNKLKKDDELKSIPLVIMSAEATPETFEQHRKLKTRAEDYLIKPFAPAELLKRIAQLVELPPGPEAPAVAAAEEEEVVTLDDVEELETTGERPVTAGEDDDLKLLDEAFESLAAESAPTPGAPDEVASSDVLEIDAPVATEDIDRLGADADAALAALGLDEEVAEPFVPSPPPAHAEAPHEPDPSQTGAEPLPAPPAPAMAAPAVAAAPPLAAEHDAEVQRLEDRVSELLIEISRVREALEERGSELGAAHARVAELEAEVETQRGGAREAEERSRRAAEDHARHREDATRAADEALASARGQAEAADARAAELERQLAEAREGAASEARARADADAALAEARAALAEAKERLEAADERVRSAEEVTRAAEAKAAASEAESAELTLKLEEAEQAASLRAAESEGAREQVAALTRELEEARGRAEALEADLATARGEVGALRADLVAARAEGERGAVELKRRVAELEAQTAKHEERVVKAYQKIKGDEKIREKTRKALAIALQLLEERTPGAPAAEVQPRRE
jgi:DNA-binding response OmpR family regulator